MLIEFALFVALEQSLSFKDKASALMSKERVTREEVRDLANSGRSCHTILTSVWHDDGYTNKILTVLPLTNLPSNQQRIKQSLALVVKNCDQHYKLTKKD